MQVKCEYCGSMIDENEKFCPSCGAANALYNRTAKGTPRTIEELKQWYVDHNLPPKETTRFFIGENYLGARAFGIYEENGHYIVYKNKSDGSRAIRYDGTDEAYAVNELYQKLKTEILYQKEHQRPNNRPYGSNYAGRPRRAFHSIRVLCRCYFTMILLMLAVIAAIFYFSKDYGYYSYGGNQYYYHQGWYEYDSNIDDWYSTTAPDELDQNWRDYYEGYDSSSGKSITDASSYDSWSSSWYSSSSSDSSWDSDSSWSSSDSWSSDSSSGWDSDW